MNLARRSLNFSREGFNVSNRSLSIRFGEKTLNKSHRLSFYCTGTQILQIRNDCRKNKTAKTDNSKNQNHMTVKTVLCIPYMATRIANTVFPSLDRSNLAPTWLSACTELQMPRLKALVGSWTLASETAINLAAAT